MRNGLIFATLVAIVVGVSALLQAGGDSKSSGSQAKAGGGSLLKTGSKVDIADFKYKPPNFSVKAGSKITFTNQDTAPHTATAKVGKAFDTGRLSKGQSKAVTFSKAGDFKYYCVYHAFMTGDVKVVK